jgi:CRISPR/Cas system-associated exonuclease Cas4 (RecB family)
MKPYLSPSQIDMFCRCPEQWRRRYIEGERIPPGIAMLKGTGVHGAARANFQQKVESHVDLPPGDIVDAAVATFEQELHGGYQLTDDEGRRGPDIVLGEAKDEVRDMAEFFAGNQAGDYQPILVERSIRIELPQCSHDLLGVIDLADDLYRVTDFKTSKKRKSQDDADTSVQLTIYAAAFHAEMGTAPTEVRLDTIVKTAKKTERQVLPSSRGAADFEALANRINSVAHAIQSGSFPPAPPGAWWCSPAYCGYWSTCRYVNSERKAMAFEV